MPHISVEATPRLASSLDFKTLFAVIHRRLASDGHGALDDFKSRVLLTATHLAGEDPAGEFIVARLVTHNPRPREVQLAMALAVHDVLTTAVAAEPRPY